MSLEKTLEQMCKDLEQTYDCEEVVIVVKRQGLKPVVTTLGSLPECLHLSKHAFVKIKQHILD